LEELKMDYGSDVMDYVENEGWTVNYSNGQVQSHWGETFDVVWGQADSCHELLGLLTPVEHKIVIKKPCDEYTTLYTAESLEEVGAKTLAHELGHADSYPISIGLQAIIIGASLLATIKNQSPKPIGYGLIAYGTSRVFVDELLAESCAAYFHGAPFMGSMAVALPDLVERVSRFF
jgi:hypothetical protein